MSSKLLMEIARILKNLVVEINSQGLPKDVAIGRMVGLIEAIEKWANDTDFSVNEKLDFLIFMQSKRIPQGKKEIIVPGQELFNEWVAAKNKIAAQPKAQTKSKLKPIPNEETNGKD